MERHIANRFRLYAILFCATLAAYFPALGGGFIWNDSDYVTKPALRSLGGLWRIWFDVGATQQYYPLLHSAFWFEHLLWGDAAFGYHLVNVLLHATSACLLFVVVERLTKGAMAAWLAAFLFALHPVYVESVAWISEQKNTLSTVFYLLALLAYLRWEAGGGRWEEKDINPSPPTSHLRPPTFYWVAFALFLCAVLTKTVAATLPGALLVIFWWKRGRLEWKRDVVPLIPFFAVGAALGLFTAWVERTYVGAQGADFALSLPERCLVAGHAVWFYLAKFIWPANLIFIYPRWDPAHARFWEFAYPVGAIALAVVLWRVRGRTRAPLAAYLFFLGSLFPVCGFFNLYAFIYSYVADHWQYLPSIGIVVLAAGGWEKVAQASGLRRLAQRDGRPPRQTPRLADDGGPPVLFSILPVGLLAVLGILTFRQSGMYRDMETFYHRTIEQNPGCWMAENNLGITLENKGRYAEAYQHYERALQIQPNARAHYNLGMILRRQGKPAEALAQFEEAVRLDPGYADAHNNLGSTLGDLGRPDEAMAEFQRALKLEPDSPGIRQNLGIALAERGDFGGAIRQLREALRIAPDFAEGHANLGAILRHENRYGEAIVELQRAVQLKPGMVDARVNLGTALAVEKRYDEAARQLEEAVRLAPNFAVAHNFLGAVYARLGRTEDARREFNEALRIDPDFKNVRESLGRLPPAGGSGQ